MAGLEVQSALREASEWSGRPEKGFGRSEWELGVQKRGMGIQEWGLGIQERGMGGHHTTTSSSATTNPLPEYLFIVFFREKVKENYIG